MADKEHPKRKWVIASILIVILIVVCAAIVLVSWMSISRLATSGVSLRVLHVDRYSAEGDQDWAFQIDAPAELVVDSRAGEIKLIGGKGNEIQVNAHKTAWDSTQKSADAALAEMPIEVKQEGNKVTVRYKPPEEVLIVGETRLDTVDFTITVPEGTKVDASAGSGDVTLQGLVGDANLHTEFGDITASDMEGGLQAKTNSGDIRALQIRAGQSAINLQTEFGDIDLEQAAAGTVEVHTNSGKITLKEVDASGGVTLVTQFGDIDFTGGRAKALNANTNSGKVTLDSLTVADALVAKSEFGDLDARQVTAASYDLNTNSGDIRLQGGNDMIKADTQFGRIDISGAQNANLDLHTNSGAIEFSGSLGSGPHILQTDFGDIRLKLPKDAQLTFDLQTEFGKLKSDFEITISGEIDEGHWRGTINGGGPSLQAKVNSGNISLEFLSQ